MDSAALIKLPRVAMHWGCREMAGLGLPDNRRPSKLPTHFQALAILSLRSWPAATRTLGLP